MSAPPECTDLGSDTPLGLTNYLYVKSDLVPIEDVIKDVCARVGITGANIDTTDIEDIEIRGYVRTRRMTPREVIEELTRAFHFDVVQS